MADPLPDDVTTLLEAIRGGDESARSRLVGRLYRELHRMAVRLMRRQRPDHTLQPTALLHEALVRLFRGEALQKAPDRAYLFGAAARAMRQVLADHARGRAAGKRGKGRPRVGLDAVVAHFEEQNLDVLAVHEALERLATFHERQSQVVTLRFLCGFTEAEIAERLGVSVTTVQSDWRVARAWLHQQLRGSEP